MEAVATEHFWMSGIYWGLAAMHLLGRWGRHPPGPSTHRGPLPGPSPGSGAGAALALHAATLCCSSRASLCVI